VCVTVVCVTVVCMPYFTVRSIRVDNLASVHSHHEARSVLPSRMWGRGSARVPHFEMSCLATGSSQAKLVVLELSEEVIFDQDLI